MASWITCLHTASHDAFRHIVFDRRVNAAELPGIERQHLEGVYVFFTDDGADWFEGRTYCVSGWKVSQTGAEAGAEQKMCGSNRCSCRLATN